MGLGIIVLGPNTAQSSGELLADHGKYVLHTCALLAACCKHRLCLCRCRQQLLGQNNHLPMLFTTTLLNFCGLPHHS